MSISESTIMAWLRQCPYLYRLFWWLYHHVNTPQSFQIRQQCLSTVQPRGKGFPCESGREGAKKPENFENVVYRGWVQLKKKKSSACSKPLPQWCGLHAATCCRACCICMHHLNHAHHPPRHKQGAKWISLNERAISPFPFFFSFNTTSCLRNSRIIYHPSINVWITIKASNPYSWNQTTRPSLAKIQVFRIKPSLEMLLHHRKVYLAINLPPATSRAWYFLLRSKKTTIRTRIQSFLASNQTTIRIAWLWINVVEVVAEEMCSIVRIVIEAERLGVTVASLHSVHISIKARNSLNSHHLSNPYLIRALLLLNSNSNSNNNHAKNVNIKRSVQTTHLSQQSSWAK